MTRIAVDAYLGLGTNLGDRRTNLRRALTALHRCGTITGLSSVWETEPVGFRDQPRFWNVVARITTALPPAGLLAAVKGIEREVGRTPRFRDGPREIDIDLLLYDDVILRTGALHIPHPRMDGRAFVLRPLAELDDARFLPGSGRTVRAQLDRGGPFEEAVPLFPGADLMESE